MEPADTVTQALTSWSPPLLATIQKRPDLLDRPNDTDTVTLRYHRVLIETAAEEWVGSHLGETTRRLSDRLDRLIADELATAVEGISDKHPAADQLSFAVIAMGKWGAREINYYSDIDLVFVHEPEPGSETEDRATALALASRLLSNLTAPTVDGPALNVDVDLRPEGTIGPLSRSLESYTSYYGRWGEAWELQALLKCRFVAGDADLGARFESMAKTIIWERGLDPDAIRSIRLLKERVESGALPNDIKRARGGIRDIEFAVQLLQLVHGRFDEDLRIPATLDAISALAGHGYIDGDEAEALTGSYEFLRTVEHRLQLHELKQTHEIPTDPETLEWLADAVGLGSREQFDERLREVRATARDVHERLYFRPILDSLVGVDQTSLDPDRAAVRLAALGFRDVTAASTAVNELTSGLSRRSRVMHQALPLMLDWLSQSPDPDLGLSQLRLLLANTPDHGAVVGLLQNNPLAGQRLCTLLGTGKLVGDLLDRIPEFIPRLADDAMIGDIRDSVGATERLLGLLAIRPDRDARIGTIRRFVRRRKLRIAARDILGAVPPQATIRSLSDSADAAVEGALFMLVEPDDQFGVVAMGKWGGRELSYGSDLDLFYIHTDDQTSRGLELASAMSAVLSEPNKHGEAFELDADLRPEGRKGPISRSLSSFRRYYSDWVEPWELLALIRARPAAGDSELLAAYGEMLEEVVWVPKLGEEVERAIRAIKARVETERMPPGEDPDFHLKLGPGGLTDVEFVTGLLQLRHGGLRSGLRVTGTFDALTALRDEELLTSAEYHALHDAYLFCTRVRLRLHLQSGRVTDSLPSHPEDMTRLASSLGFDRSGELREQYRRYTRRARRVFEELFFE